MHKRLSVHAAALIAFAALPLVAAQADGILYQSATLGPTGIAEFTPETPGTNVNQSVFVGARFELTEPVVTSQIGGHFLGNGQGTFFGALVALTGPTDFPDSSDLTTPDVLGSTILIFPTPSAEVLGDLQLALEPGWYSVVFGSGLFGADGGGAAVRNNTDIASPQIVGWSVTSNNWFDVPNGLTSQRFVLQGSLVPEPQSIMLLFVLAMSPVICIRGWPRQL